jgi:hypothetical protein
MGRIEVTISPSGEVQMDGQGFTGTGCDTAMRAIEQAVGTVAERGNTPEYYVETVENSQEHFA